MDGDSLLIQFVKERPPLWNTSLPESKDIQLKTKLWKEIGSMIDKNTEWVELRWKSLHQRFLAGMKLANSNKRIPKIKYFREMMFIKPYITALSPKNDKKVKSVNKETKVKSKEPIVISENQEDYESDDTVEFSVSQNDLDEDDNNIDTKENIFVELSDTEEEVILKKRPVETTQKEEDLRVAKIIKLDVSENQISKTTTTTATASTQHEQNILETVVSLPSVISTSSSIVPQMQPINSPMCEDRIFGDLVTAMLMKLNEQEKRIAKRKIMEILL